MRRLGWMAGLAAAWIAAPVLAQPVSVYTPIEQKDCKVIKKAAPGDGEWAITRCGGIDGWHVHVDYDDAREYVRLVRPGVDLKLPHGVATFSTVGPKLEWRRQSASGPIYAVIYRVRWKDPTTKRTRSRLVVAKLDGWKGCVVAYVESSVRNMNARARQVADTDAQGFTCGTPVMKIQ